MSIEVAVHLVKIPVSNIQESVNFYRNVIGLEEEFVFADYGWAQLKASNLSIALYVAGMGGGTGKAGEMDSLHLSVSSFDGLNSRLATANINTSDIHHTGDDGSEYYEINDPDGNIIKIFKV